MQSDVLAIRSFLSFRFAGEVLFIVLSPKKEGGIKERERERQRGRN